jgi:hypothetical protein
MIDENSLKIIAREPHRLGRIIGKNKLTPLHSEWIHFCWNSNGPRALQAFRGGYKTTAITLVGAIVWMLFHPNDRIAIIRKTFTAAANVIRAIAGAMEREEIQAVFKLAHGAYPRPEISREGNLKYSFKDTDTPEGNLTALGLDSGITGLHFDKIICDDIIILKDRISRAERERTKEIVRELQANIIEPGKGSAWIGTPWHREDAWSVIRGFCPVAKYPLSKFNFIGEEEAEQKKLTTTPFLFQANYELELNADESALFSDPVFSSGWDYTVSGAMAHLDSAYDGDHYCALTIAAPLHKEGSSQYYQITGFTYSGNVKSWLDEIVRLCRKYRAGTVFTETNADKGFTADKLREKGLSVRTYAEKQNKHLKISTCLFDVWRFLEWAPETDDEYLNQVIDYREGAEPDDAPDSAASLFREGFGKSRRSCLSQENIDFFSRRR